MVMNMEVNVSVIIPVYNAGKTLKRCLDSILKSTYKDYEVILVDDGSKDNSYDISLDYSNKYSFIKVIKNNKNRKVSYTRNHGLKNAIGKYICFVDSDDLIKEDYLEKLVNEIEYHSNSFIICGFINDDMIYNNRIDHYVYDQNQILSELDFDNSLLDLYDKTLIQQLWNKIFIRSIIVDNDIQFDESLSIGEDTRFVLEYLKYLKPNKILFMNECLYHYKRDQENSLMFNTGYEKIDNLIDNLKSLLDLTSLSSEIKSNIIHERKNKMIENYAYIIYHNPKMKEKVKKELILKLDKEKGYDLYKKNRILYLKEKVSKFINRR